MPNLEICSIHDLRFRSGALALFTVPKVLQWNCEALTPRRFNGEGATKNISFVHEGPPRAAKNTFFVHEGPLRATKNTFFLVAERGDQGRIGSLLHADVLDLSRSVSNSPSVNAHKHLYVLAGLKRPKEEQASRSKRFGRTGVFMSDDICASFVSRNGKAGEDELSCLGEKSLNSGCGENCGTHRVDTLY